MNKDPYKPFNYKYVKLAVLLLFIIAIAGVSYLLYYNSILSYKTKDFHAYQKDFEVIKDVAERQRPKTDRKYFCISIGYAGGKPYISLLLDTSGHLESYDIELNEEEQKSLDRIKTIFERLDAIRVYKDRIAFDSDVGYAIIYSENGKSPRTEVINGKEVKIKSIRINRHWFHAAYQP